MLKNPLNHSQKILPIKSDNNLWSNHSEKWQLVTGPLRPCVQDVEIFQSQITDKNLNALILGVTPELQNLTTKICAVDNNPQMLKNFAGSNLEIICENWQSMKPSMFSSAPFAYIFGDGSFNVIQFGDWQTVLAKLPALLKKDGKVICRFFIAPNYPEKISDIISMARNKKIPNFSAFKWHFAMALNAINKIPDIAVRQIYDAFNEEIPNRQEFAQATGWPLTTINTIDHYKDAKSIYNFPTLEQMKLEMEKHLRIISIDYGNYYLADRCPIVTFKLL